jgi:hypothetical protein
MDYVSKPVTRHAGCCFLEIMKRLVSALCSVLVFGLAGQSHATVIFSDNFDAENGGIGQLNYNAFANWSVSHGTVDLIGRPVGFFDFFPSNGLYVDLDGTSFQAGRFTSTGIHVTPGNYILSFLLAGSQRGDVNTVQVNVSGLASSTYTFASNVPLTPETMSFTVLAPTTIHLSFQNEGSSNNIGLVLDNVNLDRVSGAVPDSGSTTVLLGIAMIGLGLMGWKFRRLA